MEIYHENKNLTAERLASGVIQQETGYLDDPWIRTQVRDAYSTDKNGEKTYGSSAFGPYQITRKAFAEIAKFKNLTPRQTQFITDMTKEQDLFLMHGNQGKINKDGKERTPSDWFLEQYDYGGKGKGLSATQKEDYLALGQRLVSNIWNKAGGDLKEFVAMYYGSGDEARNKKYRDSLAKILDYDVDKVVQHDGLDTINFNKTDQNLIRRLPIDSPDLESKYVRPSNQSEITAEMAWLFSAPSQETSYIGNGIKAGENGYEVSDYTNFNPEDVRYFDEEQNINFTTGEQFQAFFNQENTAFSYYAKQAGSDIYNPDFEVEKTAIWQQNPDIWPRLLAANNYDDALAITNNYNRETREREIVAATSLPASFGIGMLAMGLDPVLAPAMIYTGGTAYLARLGIAKTALLYGGVASSSEALAEMFKHDTQAERTIEESVVNVVASGLFSALFGGAAGAMAQRSIIQQGRRASLQTAEMLMEQAPDGVPTNPVARATGDGVDSAGAARNEATVQDWERTDFTPEELALKETGIGLEKLAYNPLMRLSKSKSVLARRLAPMLADSPFYYKAFDAGRRITGRAGSIESQKRQYIAKHVVTMRKVEESYLKARGMNSAKAALLDITGKTEQAGGTTWADYNANLGKAIRRGDPTGDPLIDDAVNMIREDLIKPIMNDAIEAGLFDDGIAKFADTYFPRLYDFEKLKAESDATPDGFVFKVKKWLEKEQGETRLKMAEHTGRMNKKATEVDEAFSKLKEWQDARDGFATDYKRYREALRFDIDPNNAADIQTALGLSSRPLSLAAFIREKGGIRDSGGELAARDITNKSYVALRDDVNGLDAEQLIEMAVEDGYYLVDDYNEVNMSEFFDDIMDDINGIRKFDYETQYNINDFMGNIQHDPDFKYATQDLGLNRKSTKKETIDAMMRDNESLKTPDDFKAKRKEARALEKERARIESVIDGYSDFAYLSEVELQSIAGKVKQNILGMNRDEFNDVLLPKHDAFKTGHLKQRRLTIDDLEIEGYLVNRADDVLDYYTKSVSPQILVSKNFGDINMSAPIQKINLQYENAKIQNEAEMMKDGASEKEIIKATQKITDEQEDAIKDIEALRDKLYGQYNRPNDPDSFWNRSGHFIKALNFTRLLGGMTIAALPDLARPVMTLGLKPVASSLMALKGNKGLINAAKKDLDAAHVALDSITTNVSNRYSDLTQYTGHRTKSERAVETGTNLFAKAALMPMWNDTLKGFSGLAVQNEMAKAVLSANPTKRQIRELSKQGIGAEEIEGLRHMLKEFGEDGDIFVPNGDNWESFYEQVSFGDTVKITEYDADELRTLWRSAVGSSVNQIIVTPGIGEMPLWVSGSMAQIIMQFKSFAISAHSRVLISGLQAQDAAAAQGLLLGAGLGAIVMEIKAAQSGRETPDNVGDYIYDALDRGGFFGWLNEPIQLASKFTRGATSPSRLWGSDRANVSKYQNRNIMGIFGPTTDLFGDLAAVSGALSAGEWEEADQNALRKLLPLQNLFYFKFLTDALKD